MINLHVTLILLYDFNILEFKDVHLTLLKIDKKLDVILERIKKLEEKCGKKFNLDIGTNNKYHHNIPDGSHLMPFQTNDLIASSTSQVTNIDLEYLNDQHTNFNFKFLIAFL